jgi:hypothetical protein
MRLVVEHEDGRRVGVEDTDYGRTSGNPWNVPSKIVRIDSDEISTRPGRDEAEQQSLQAEGFKVVAAIDDEGHERELTAAERRKYQA